MLAIDGVWRDRVPVVVLVLPFDMAPLWMIICFFGAINIKERLFEKGYGFGLDRRKISSVYSISQLKHHFVVDKILSQTTGLS